MQVYLRLLNDDGDGDDDGGGLRQQVLEGFVRGLEPMVLEEFVRGLEPQASEQGQPQAGQGQEVAEPHLMLQIHVEQGQAQEVAKQDLTQQVDVEQGQAQEGAQILVHVEQAQELLEQVLVHVAHLEHYVVVAQMVLKRQVIAFEKRVFDSKKPTQHF